MKTKKKTPPCHKCPAKCCSYFALQIDTPETIDDFEDIRWYLLHKKSFVFVDDDSWFLQINTPCRYIGKDNKCTIYKSRPSICRNYGWDDDDDVLCDYTTKDISHDLEFHSDKDLLKFMKKRFPGKKLLSGKK